jgi:hypothetical protein
MYGVPVQVDYVGYLSTQPGEPQKGGTSTSRLRWLPVYTTGRAAERGPRGAVGSGNTYPYAERGQMKI